MRTYRQVDGRRTRGERRRTEIIEATLQVIERAGVSGVTHRSVAAAAGIPPASITYHFGALDDLLEAALVQAAADLVDRVRELIESRRIKGDDPAGAVAEMLAEALGPRRARTAARYELYLLAARRPDLRPVARLWLDVLTSLGRRPDEVGFRAFLAGIDGMLAQGLIDDEPPTAAELLPVVRHLLAPLR
ncbi:TetR/AcrR family transcriptional regulator [Actinokineospora enzanensis]|uniref:TetR/AcrR family transcriptional regulator n=1 Tax=Actinokineospora enzanensis TaxID=155975 RepID=UPI0003631B18|nr:TetR family transcriptional regulator [Actinokineospora enzanensis]